MVGNIYKMNTVLYRYYIGIIYNIMSIYNIIISFCLHGASEINKNE